MYAGISVITWLSVLLALRFHEVQSDIPCPERYCICTNDTANCSNHGSNLTYFPKLPISIRMLNFSGNLLVNITKSTFEPIRRLPIKSLFLAHNQIQHISAEAFEGLTNLKYLYLGGNKIPVDILKNSFYGLRQSKLEQLFLPHMDLPDLPVDMFNYLKNCPIFRLELYYNKMTKFIGRTYAILKKLNTLVVSNNRISIVDLNNLPKLEALFLRWNNLIKIPEFCNNESKSIIPNVIKLDLGDNLITNITQENLKQKCLPKIHNLNLDSNPIEMIPDNTFSNLQVLTSLTLTWMKVFKFRFGKFAFNISSLEYLYIQNRLDFPTDNDFIQNVYRGCPKLKELDMAKNRLYLFSADMLYTLFSPLRHLQKLVLQATSIQYLPSNLFLQMPHLWNLNFKNCMIHGWDPSTFKNVTKLRYLYLDHNQISIINQSSFPNELLNSLTHLNLGYNPFSCICNLLWFRNWVRNNKRKLMYYPRSYKCSSPPQLANKLLEMYNPSDEECFPISPYIILGIVLSIVVVTAAVIGGTLYRYRWHIKHYIYLIRSRRNYERLPGDDDEYVYDAFVAYHSDDRVWIISELIPCLEKRENLKLCVHDRDFDVGTFIVDNIITTINKSRKIILILSNEFAKSRWCQFETMMAQNRHIQEGGDVLILVMLEDIQARYMSNSLHSVLQTTTFIEWTRQEPGQQLFWKRLIACVKDCK